MSEHDDLSPDVAERPASGAVNKEPMLIRPGSGREPVPGAGSRGFVGAGGEEGRLFEKLRAGLRHVEVDGERFYVAEGDTLLTEAELQVYANEREQRERLWSAIGAASSIGLGTEPLARSRGLVVQTQAGRIVRWKPGSILTYRVARNTFPDQQSYDLVVASMQKATSDWEQTCGCDFRHRADLDQRPEPGPAGAVFWVRYYDSGGAFLAAAFFPNDPRSRWHVLVDPSLFTQTTFDRAGIFRHELGHVLGFRHEHIRKGAPPACPDEPTYDTKNLTTYDPQSVMHYFCGGIGSRSLSITELDRSGSQQVYGPPLGQLAFVDDAAP